MSARTRMGDWLAWTLVPEAETDWDAVYREELPRVYNFFRFRVGDGPIAEDLTSATFEKAWRARDRYRRERAAFSTWLFAIARNVAVDYFRARRETVAIEDAGEPATRATPESDAIERERFDRLSRLLALLPDRERELLAMKYGAGLTNRAIASATGLSESNVGTIIHRAVAGLRAAWHE